ncbi:MAG: glycerophosphodiester phosphodiesterase [Planctomycetota bacterium]|nr:glycerophosphodiester phosphodiesterase [Planctomycetota bacterium]
MKRVRLPCWKKSLVVASFCGGGSMLQAVEIIAHRGASADAPENTVASARLGYEQGADAVECDIYLTKDGKLVVIHDATTKRATAVEGKVSDMTLAELKALDAGSWKGKQFAGERIPTLDEILATVPAGKRLVIELKCGKAAIPELKAALDRAGKDRERVQFICFQCQTLQALKKEIPGHQACWLVGYERDKKTGQPSRDLEALIRQSRDAGLEGLSLSSDWPIDAAFARKVHDAGLKLYVWTVDDAALARRLVSAGVEGITTNRPAWLRQNLAQ